MAPWDKKKKVEKNDVIVSEILYHDSSIIIDEILYRAINKYSIYYDFYVIEFIFMI
jgi:hypothetical protein